MPEEGIRLLRGGVTGCCEPSDVGIELRSSGNSKCLPLLFHTLVLFASFSTLQIPCSPRPHLTPQGKDLVGIVWPNVFQICPPFPLQWGSGGDHRHLQRLGTLPR